MFEHAHLARTIPLAANGDAVRAWGLRLGERAHGALWLRRELDRLSGHAGEDRKRIGTFHTGDGAPSVLDLSGSQWLRLTETQISRNLARFLTEGGAGRVLAFLKALPCRGVDLPDTLDRSNARAEVGAKGGRIDLLVTGEAGGRVYGAALEIKIDHHLHNPLGAYARVARESGLSIPTRGTPATAPATTGVLVVLGRSSSARTRTRLRRNHGWRFVHWSAFLRRFERTLAGKDDDDEFRQFRRMMWDRFA